MSFRKAFTGSYTYRRSWVGVSVTLPHGPRFVAEYSTGEFAALKLMLQKFVTLKLPFKVVYRNSYIICAPGHFLPDLPLLILPSSRHRVSRLHLSLHQQPINMLLLRVHQPHMHLRTDLFLMHNHVQLGHRYLARPIRVHP